MTTVTWTREQQPSHGGVAVAPQYLPTAAISELLAAFSMALDLAEGRQKGHALRVCYIASALARHLGMPKAQRSATFYAALLHDAGVPHASEAVKHLPRLYEQELFAAAPLQGPDVLAARVGVSFLGPITEAFHEHAYQGASAAAALGLPPNVAEAILCHHERHDGSGYPLGLSGNEVPPVARVVSVADFADGLLANESNPLMARRKLIDGLRDQAGRSFHPAVVDALINVVREDSFWLDFHNFSLPALIVEFGDVEARTLEPDAMVRLAGTFAGIVDAKAAYKRGHSRRVAGYARSVAEQLGCGEDHVQAIEISALLHDLGMLRVPSRIIDKPEILTVQDMTILHEHPIESAGIIGAIPGWGHIASWTAAHHERLDGRGYPEQLSAIDIPLEARILALADIYGALTADRPHRAAHRPAAALAIMRGMIGQNIDPEVFAAFESVAHRTPEEDLAGE